jgi:hypothetical protein
LGISNTSSIHVDPPFSTTVEGESMSTKNTGSVFQKENGYLGYRFVVKIDGKRIDRRCSFDEHGNKFRTKREAAIAREEAMRNLRIE